MPLLESLRERIRAIEDRWFDWTRRVNTAQDAGAPARPPAAGDSYGYLPARAANVREALRRLPVACLSRYSFIDIGSGKGRVLFIASEFPFTRVIGVEFSRQLHDAAVRNLALGRTWRRRCESIELVLANAAEYEFPPGPLVVYLFNPFGPEIMRRMLDNLERAFAQQRSHILLLMLWPEHAAVAARCAWLRQVQRTRRYCLFEAGSESPAA